MRRLIFCFDGTWNKLSNPEPTNVVLLAESVAPRDDQKNDQIVYYDEGVGTSKYDKIRGGISGVGLITNMREAYRFLIFNYRPSDEIFVFGFSRGAFTALSFIGLLRTAGILRVTDAEQIDRAFELYKANPADVDDDSIEKREFRAKYSQVVIDGTDRSWRETQGYPIEDTPELTIKYLGVWDTVAALGVPTFLGPLARWFVGRFYGFHDVRLTKTVARARHAVAIDEYRAHFPPTLWRNVHELNENLAYQPDAPYQQVWFPGDHGSVGGGGEERGHSSAALHWVLQGAVEEELKVHFGPRSRITNLQGNYKAPLRNTPTRGVFAHLKRFFVKLITHKARKGPEHEAEVSPQAMRRYIADPAKLHERAEYRPKPLQKLKTDLIKVANKRFKSEGIEEAIAVHEVKAGETLGMISFAYYGDPNFYTLIFEFNRDALNDPDSIFPGQILRIPPKPETNDDDTAPAKL